MQPIRRTGIALIALALIASIGTGQQMQQKANKRAVPPEIANANAVKLISTIKWYDSLDAALEEARKESKLVFYMHMLGKIDGNT